LKDAALPLRARSRPRANRALRDRSPGIRNDLFPIDLNRPPEAVARVARAERRVEREEGRPRRLERAHARRTYEAARDRDLRRIAGAILGAQLRASRSAGPGDLDRFFEPASIARAHRDPIDDDLDAHVGRRGLARSNVVDLTERPADEEAP